MSLANHSISVGFGREGFFLTTEDIKSYEVVSDMLTLADSFAIELPVKRRLWDLVRPDSEVQVWIDDSQVLAGFVDDRVKSEGSIQVSGRDRGGRLVDESAPLVRFGGKGIKELALDVVGDWFPAVVLSNATNRRLIGGRGAKRNRGREPAILVGDEIRHKVMPGETRAEVISSFLEQAGLMAWSAANGKTFIVGKPNQTQEPAWHVFNPEVGSARRGEANVLELEYSESVAERYSEITVCGSGRGDTRNYGRVVTKRRATVRAPAGDFFRPKRLLLADQDIRNPSEARRRAEREQAELDAGGIRIEATMPGHGQTDARVGVPAIFSFDTVARVEDEEIGLADDFFVTRCVYEGTKGSSSTALSMVPLGTELRSSG